MLAAYVLVLGGLAAQPAAGAAPTSADPTPRHQAQFELGSGLTFSFDRGRHEVSLGGFIQPSWGVQSVEDGDTDQFLNARRTHLILSGRFYGETARFFLQTDFSRSEPLLDAWLEYRPFDFVAFSAGQRLTVTNNRESLHMESQLGFVDRSLLSRTFSESGRELGLFVFGEAELGGVLVRPQVAVTSGDGRNSFGDDSRDRDIGGLKWGGRLDVLPFGDFSEGNRGMVVDLAHEPTFKLVLGGAASYNDGASHRVGAGHGDFLLYDEFGDEQGPDYRLVYGDVLAKFMGFSLLFEYANASATSLDGAFTNEAASIPLLPTEISELLVLGNGINVQLGYYFTFGLGVDVRYSQLFAEFGDNGASLLQDTRAYAGGLAYYLKDHAMKVQLNVERIEVDGAPSVLVGDLLVQLIL